MIEMTDEQREMARQTREANIQAGKDLPTLSWAPKPEQYAALALRARKSPKAAIRLKCLECAGWSTQVAKTCEIRTCALFEVSNAVFRRIDPASRENAYENQASAGI